MTTFNTNWREIATYQNEKEPDINTQRGRLDAALTEQYELAGDTSPTLTVEEFRALMAIDTDGTQTAAQSITVPSTVKKIFIVDNSSSYDLTIIEGTKEFLMLPGARAAFYASGVADSLVRIVTISNAGFPMRMAPAFELADTSSQTVYLRTMIQGQTLLSIANGLEAEAYVGTAPDGNTDFSLRKNGVEVGTMQILSGAKTGTFTVASDVSFSAGDRFSIVVTTANSVGKNYAMAINLT